MSISVDIQDSKYKTYASQIEKALRAFENTSEWADLIASLARLNKVLVAHSRYSIIPKKILIGKRLAQCLHPALPSGVHLKALETYDLIFKCIGTDKLALDIFTYCSGLFPFLGYAAINVRPTLLLMYETHFLPLSASIKPAMTGLIMGLLPGLENGSEFYERTYQLLESFCDCVEKSYFYCCLWECISVSASVRHAGLNFVLMHFDKKSSMDDQIYLIGTSLDLLVQALCFSLEDTSPLVQRCVLDLLILCFPIHNCQLPNSDIVKILMYAVTVLLRRDMSLNRRLYAWLMGTDINGMPLAFSNKLHLSQHDPLRNQEMNYFSVHSKEILISAVRKLLENDFDAKFSKITLLSLKIIISLLDRPELISDILSDLLLDILRCLYRECVIKLNENVKKIIEEKMCFNDSPNDESFLIKMKNEEQIATVEIYKTANILFAKFDPHFIWAFIAELFETACSQSIINIREFGDILNFLLDKISMETCMEMQVEHFPTFVGHMITIMECKLDDLSNSDIASALNLCLKIFSRTMTGFGMFVGHCSNTTCRKYSKPKDGFSTEEEDKLSANDDNKCMHGSEHFTRFEVYDHITEFNSHQNECQHQDKHSSPQSSVVSLLKNYLIFFHQLIFKRIIKAPSPEFPCMEYLISYSNKDASWEIFNELVLVEVKVDPLSTAEVEVLEYACQLLEKCLTSGKYDVLFDISEIPRWFRSLLVICMATPFSLQYVALNHVLNFVEVCRISRDSCNFHRSCIKILNETCFYRITASSIWKYISKNSYQISLKAIEVFNRIHQNAPNSWICEDVIAKDLFTLDQETKIKSSIDFINFWNGLKNLDGIKSRQFEKLILVLLDNLDNNNYMFASLSKSWITSCAKSGDLIPILEPIVKILLHPDTARVSVQQNDSQMTRKQAFNITGESVNSAHLIETKIIAVSNEGGNIMYHVDNQNKQKSLKRLSPEEFQSLILTSLSEHGSDTKKCSVLLDNYSENSKLDVRSVTLHVNPFGTSEEENLNMLNMSPNDENIRKHARRLDLRRCADEEICFNEMDFVLNSNNLNVKAQIVSELLDEILVDVVSNSKASKEGTSEFIDSEFYKDLNESTFGDTYSEKNVNSMKSYILLYIRKYDFSRVLYGIRLMKSVVATDSMLILNVLLTSNFDKILIDKIEAGSAIDLFLRHKQSIMGQNFHCNLMFDVSDNISGGTYLELIVFGLLYFVRSFFNSEQKLSSDDIQKNKEVQISCCTLLHMLFIELSKLLKQNVRLVQHISNLLLKSKVQKTVLYSLYSGLQISTDEDNSVTIPTLSRMYTNVLLALTTSLIQLEDYIQSAKGDLSNDCLPKEFEQMNLSDILSLKKEVLFLSGQPIIYQPIFLEAIIYSLRSSNDEQMHSIWIGFVQNLLPYFSKASVKILSSVILQLCSNMETFENTATDRTLTPEYYVFLIKSLTSMYHYCLFDSTVCDYKTFSNQTTEGGILQSFSGQLISGFSNAFNFPAANKGRKFNIQEETPLSSDSQVYSKVLDLLPKILTNILNAWTFSDNLDILSKNKSSQMNFTWSNRVKECVLCFLNPLANNFVHSLLASFTIIWNERFIFKSYELMVDAISSDQLAIVNILKEMRHINLNTLAAAIKQMLKQPGFFSLPLHKWKFLTPEGGLLQIFYAFIKQLPNSTITESVNTIINFLRECYHYPNMDSSATFVLISTLHFILRSGPVIEEKREHRDIHDITNKLLESCSNIAGLSLEQAYFFRRYLAVKEDFVLDLDSKNDEPQEKLLSKLSSSANQQCRTSTFSQSVQALHVLADVTATLLDVVFQSDEKDKVTPLLSNILLSVFPYLRSHKLSNMASFSASSKLIANLSSYQYTRRSWKKECFELLMDSCFFQMDLKSLKCWIIIIDNLMAHDKSTFLDLLARFSLAQSSSLNLFGSREAESEMKIQLLKRMSFTIFCSETDQYQKYMPDIQEKLFDCLRSHNSPRLHAEVFSCFRVLVLRMSCYCLTSLWPTMITELIQVLDIIEQNLTLESEDILRNNKSTDSLVNARCDKNNDLYLAACKLLDLFLALPFESLSHFQLYKWAFVADSHTTCLSESIRFKSKDSGFVPYALKIAKLMQTKFGSIFPKTKLMNRLVIHTNKIYSLHELHEFFSTICQELLEVREENICAPHRNDRSDISGGILSENSSSDGTSPIKIIESIIMNDFLEKLS